MNIEEYSIQLFQWAKPMSCIDAVRVAKSAVVFGCGRSQFQIFFNPASDNSKNCICRVFMGPHLTMVVLDTAFTITWFWIVVCFLVVGLLVLGDSYLLYNKWAQRCRFPKPACADACCVPTFSSDFSLYQLVNQTTRVSQTPTWLIYFRRKHFT